MVPNDLLTYIAQGRAAGHTDAAMRDTLIGAGWDPIMVSEALSGAPMQAPMATSSLMPAATSPAPATAAMPTGPTTLAYATFWRNFFAAFIDMPISMVPTIVIMILYGVAQFAITKSISFGPDSFDLAALFNPSAVHAQGADFGLKYSTAMGLGTQDTRTGAASVVKMILGFLAFLSILFATIFYRPFFEGRRGATPGMRMLGLRVVKEDEPTRLGIGIWRSLGRIFLLGILNPPTLSIATWWMLIDGRRQTLADKILKVVVIYDPTKTFAISGLEGIPLRKKRYIWFGIFPILFVLSLIGGATQNGASKSAGRNANTNVSGFTR